MCGLVGMAGDLLGKHKDAMKDLLFFDTLRGRDSTGVASVRRNREVAVRKMCVPGYDFIDQGFFQDLCKFGDQLWLGHNRFKTRGNVSRLNAHPFVVLDEEDKISTIGAHNGTLNNQHEIEKILGEKFGTDSEGLINLIDQDGIDAAIKEAQGAWSLVWWDAPEDTINFLRNEERPMCFAYSDDRKVLIWASEAWMIINACARHDINLCKTAEGRPEVWSTIANTLYTWKIPQKVNGVFESPVKKGGLEGKPKPASSNFQGWTSSYGFNTAKQEGTKTTGQNATTVVEKGGSGVVVPINHLVPRAGEKRGYDNSIISETQYNLIKDAGCGWCGDDLHQGFAFISHDVGVCHVCTGGRRGLVV